MTSEQVTAINGALTSTTETIMSDFISVLPSIGIIIGVSFAIGFVVYWLKKLRKVR